MVSNGCQPYFFSLCQGKKGERVSKKTLAIIGFQSDI